MDVTRWTPPTLELTWADGLYAGMVVEVYPMSVATYGLPALNSLVTVLATSKSDDDRAQLPPLFDAFAAALVGWNLPYPADRAGIEQVDPRCLDAIIAQWYIRTVKVPDPLGTPSNDGESSVEESIPMDIL